MMISFSLYNKAWSRSFFVVTLFCYVKLTVGQSFATFSTNADPLIFTFDPANGMRATISWNPNSFDPRLIRRIEFRETGLTSNSALQGFNQGNLGNRFGASILKSTGPWNLLADGPQEETFSYYFIKPNFCDNYEFCILLNRGREDQGGSGISLTTGGLRTGANGGLGSAGEQCQGVSQQLSLPPVRMANESLSRVQQVFYVPQENRIRVVVETQPIFDYWRTANILSLRPNVTAEKCNKLVPPVAQEPFLDVSGKMITFDPAYAKDECVFRYQITADLQVPSGGCSVTYTTPMNESLAIRLSCQTIAGIPECRGFGVGGLDPNIRAQDTCYTCSPNIDTEATIEYNEAARENERKIRLGWTFPQSSRPERIPSEYQVRISKADLVGSFHAGAVEEGVYFDNQPYYRKFIMLTDYKDFRFANPSYLVQVCAIYRPECQNRIDWNSADRYPVRLQNFNSDWDKLEEQRRVTNSRYLYTGNTSGRNKSFVWFVIMVSALSSYLSLKFVS